MHYSALFRYLTFSQYSYFPVKTVSSSHPHLILLYVSRNICIKCVFWSSLALTEGSRRKKCINKNIKKIKNLNLIVLFTNQHLSELFTSPLALQQISQVFSRKLRLMQLCFLLLFIELRPQSVSRSTHTLRHMVLAYEQSQTQVG